MDQYLEEKGTTKECFLIFSGTTSAYTLIYPRSVMPPKRLDAWCNPY